MPHKMCVRRTAVFHKVYALKALSYLVGIVETAWHRIIVYSWIVASIISEHTLQTFPVVCHVIKCTVQITSGHNARHVYLQKPRIQLSSKRRHRQCNWLCKTGTAQLDVLQTCTQTALKSAITVHQIALITILRPTLNEAMNEPLAENFQIFKNYQ